MKNLAFFVLVCFIFVFCLCGCENDKELSLSRLVLGSWIGGYSLVNIDVENRPSGSVFVAMNDGVLTFSDGGHFSFVATCTIMEKDSDGGFSSIALFSNTRLIIAGDYDVYGLIVSFQCDSTKSNIVGNLTVTDSIRDMFRATLGDLERAFTGTLDASVSDNMLKLGDSSWKRK
jgi:hypothetical protein